MSAELSARLFGLPARLLMNWTAFTAVAHIAGVLPLAVCGIAFLARRPVAPAALLLSVGFALSFVADTFGYLWWRSGRETVWISYILVPVQMTVFLLALGRLRYERVIAAGFVLLLATSWAVSDFRSQEAVASIQAGALICVLVFRNEIVRRWRGPVLLYCGGAIPFLLVMGSSPPAENPAWVPAWAGYQLVRITALVWMAWLIFREARPKQLEVA